MKTQDKNKEANQGASLEIKEPINKGFTIIYNPLKNDKTLTADETAILWLLITSAETFKPSIRKIARHYKKTDRTINKATKSLQERGYLIIENKGTGGARWIINQQPNDTEEREPTFNELLEGAKEGNINLSQLNKLVKRHIITKQEASQIIKTLNEILSASLYDE